MIDTITYKNEAKATTERIMESVAKTSSPFVTHDILAQWIENSILTAYQTGKNDVHREHQKFAIERALEAFKGDSNVGRQLKVPNGGARKRSRVSKKTDRTSGRGRKRAAK